MQVRGISNGCDQNYNRKISKDNVQNLKSNSLLAF